MIMGQVAKSTRNQKLADQCFDATCIHNVGHGHAAMFPVSLLVWYTS